MISSKDLQNITVKLFKTLESKNSMYDNSFEKLTKKYGGLSIIISLEHKLNRIKNILLNPNNPTNNENNAIDSLMDLAGYALLSVVTIQSKNDEIESSGINNA